MFSNFDSDEDISKRRTCCNDCFWIVFGIVSKTSFFLPVQKLYFLPIQTSFLPIQNLKFFLSKTSCFTYPKLIFTYSKLIVFYLSKTMKSTIYLVLTLLDIIQNDSKYSVTCTTMSICF